MHTLSTKGGLSVNSVLHRNFFHPVSSWKHLTGFITCGSTCYNLAGTCKKRKRKEEGSFMRKPYTSPTWTSLIYSLFLTDLTNYMMTKWLTWLKWWNKSSDIFYFCLCFFPFFPKWEHLKQKKIIIQKKNQKTIRITCSRSALSVSPGSNDQTSISHNHLWSGGLTGFRTAGEAVGQQESLVWSLRPAHNEN